ncbi:MAG TPA: dihydrofolate reductase [Candidatus Saccharimonadales bacterium]|nr:dihydrofolate reductase [Candidatus Saccharimonadales bacterium]
MIRLIAAVDRQMGIGKNGGQPWKLPDDEAYFAQMTKSNGGNILVGRSTFETFKGPLPERTNYLLTSHNEPIAGVELVHDLSAFLESFKDDLWIIGGAKVYQEVIDLGKADELYLTYIDAEFGCDRFFPKFGDEFKEIQPGDWQEQNGFKFRFAKFAKI